MTDYEKFLVRNETSDDSKIRQKLLYLIRDYNDGDNDGYGYDGCKSIIDDDLEEMGNDIQRKTSCFLLNPPGVNVIKPNFNGAWSHLDEDFVKNMKDLIESLLAPEKLAYKTIFGRDTTAKEFQVLLKAYVKAFSNEKLPQVEEILQITIDN